MRRILMIRDLLELLPQQEPLHPKLSFSFF